MPVVTSPAAIPSSLPPSGAAGGDLGGTYPNPTVDLNTGGGTLNGATSIIPAASTTGLTITSPSANTTKILNLTGVHTTFTLDCDGTLVYSSDDIPVLTTRGIGTKAAVEVSTTLSSARAVLDTLGGVFVISNDGANNRFQAAESVLRFHLNAAPADGDLVAGDCAFWFDQTNGAAAFNIRAKQANGTVKTATIPVIT